MPYQIVPPTPTMLPAAPPAPITINPQAWRMWRFTDEAIMIWQQITPARTQVLQIAIIIVIILIAVVMFIVWIQSLSSGDPE